jgi:hypothetical protein
VQNFHLKLLNQHWIQGSTDPDGEPSDVTSHGDILLEINGEDISGCELPDNELGINQSAVALLQSVFINHDLNDNQPIFYHGCWILGTCPNRIIDFRVIHTNQNEVKLDHFIVTGIGNSMKHYQKNCTIPNLDYARQILEFSEESFEFLKPERGEDDEAPAYSSLRREQEALINLVKEYLFIGEISASMRNRTEFFGWFSRPTDYKS